MCYFFRKGGGKSVAGAKILTFRQIHNAIIALSAPEGGPNSIANFDGGRVIAGIAPWIRHCTLTLNRLSSLSVLYMECEKMRELNCDDIIASFAVQKEVDVIT